MRIRPIAVAICAAVTVTLSACGPHSSTSTQGAAGSLSSPSASATATLAPAPTTAEAACKDIVVDPNMAVTHNIPKDEQGFAAVLVAQSTDRKTRTDAKALVTVLGTYLDDETAEANGERVSLPDFTPQEDAVIDDCTRDFPNS